MRICRGPKSKCLIDDSYEHVADVSGKDLKNSVRLNSFVEFNITKNGSERRSVCTAHFELEDIVDMVSGLALRIKTHDKLMDRIQQTLKDQQMTCDEKVEAIKKHILYKNFDLSIV